jgi:hypothetical protein
MRVPDYVEKIPHHRLSGLSHGDPHPQYARRSGPIIAGGMTVEGCPVLFNSSYGACDPLFTIRDSSEDFYRFYQQGFLIGGGVGGFASSDDMFTVRDASVPVELLAVAGGTRQETRLQRRSKTGYAALEIDSQVLDDELNVGKDIRGADIFFEYEYDGILSIANRRGLDMEVDSSITAGVDFGSTQISRARLTLDAATRLAAGAGVDTNPVYYGSTAASASAASGAGFYHFMAEVTGAPAAQNIALQSVMKSNGAGQCIGYQGRSEASTGGTGEIVGVDGYVVPVAGTVRCIAINGNPDPFNTIAANKRLAFKGLKGAIQANAGNAIILSGAAADPAAVVTSHLNFLNAGQGYFESHVEVDGTLHADGDFDHNGTNVGLYGTAVRPQAAALTADLTHITHTAPTTPDYAIATPVSGGWGFSTQDEFETAMSVILNLQTRVAELDARLDSGTGIGVYV